MKVEFVRAVGRLRVTPFPLLVLAKLLSLERAALLERSLASFLVTAENLTVRQTMVDARMATVSLSATVALARLSIASTVSWWMAGSSTSVLFS